jgi:hypothetical protein
VHEFPIELQGTLALTGLRLPPGDLLLQVFDRERLGQVVVGAAADSLHRRLDRIPAGHDEHGDGGIEFENAVEQIEPGRGRVEQGYIGLLRGQHAEAGLGIGGAE